MSHAEFVETSARKLTSSIETAARAGYRDEVHAIVEWIKMHTVDHTETYTMPYMAEMIKFHEAYRDWIKTAYAGKKKPVAVINSEYMRVTESGEEYVLISFSYHDTDRDSIVSMIVHRVHWQGTTISQVEKVFERVNKTTSVNTMQMDDTALDNPIEEVLADDLLKALNQNEGDKVAMVCAWIEKRAVDPEIAKRFIDDYQNRCKIISSHHPYAVTMRMVVRHWVIELDGAKCPMVVVDHELLNAKREVCGVYSHGFAFDPTTMTLAATMVLEPSVDTVMQSIAAPPTLH